MNGVNILRNIFIKGINPFLKVSNQVVAQQTRSTYVLKRRNTVKPFRPNHKPHHFKRRDFLYDLVANTDVIRKPPLQLILTSYVEGIGNPGDKIIMPRLKAYNQLLLPGLAVYASPENLKKYQLENVNTDKFEFSSHFASRTQNILSKEIITITMSNVNPWTLEKWHIRSTFRRAGIYLNDDCITMPEKTISGPNLDYDNKEFYVTVTINKKEKVKVRCRLSHWFDHKHCNVKKYLEPSKALFPEDQKILDEMPIPWIHEKYLTENPDEKKK